MAAITYDGQSFTILGRRRWIVSGAIDPARTPRGLWADRIRAAKQAGLNTITVPINWSLHEPSPGRFDFEGDRDIAEFIRMIGKAGLMCILRPGPFINSQWDLGGLPAWLLHDGEVNLRSADPGFVEPCSRWISELMSRLRELQAGARKPGPIILVQVEHEWFCGDDLAGAAYLGELGRYFRENGLTVPLINCNNLYHSLESEIDAWNGFDNLHAMMRQLRSVRPNAPRLVADFILGSPGAWGEAQVARATPAQAVHRLAQILASGAQFNLGPFHGGTNFGFKGGRRPGVGYSCAAADWAAPLGEAGQTCELYHAVKRICTFASSFERVFTALDPDHQPAALDPGAGAGSVIHCRGARGGAAFVFGDDAPGTPGTPSTRNGVVTLTLPDGAQLPIDLRGQPVVWCLFNALLHNRSTLDYCNLSAFALLGAAFVCYGPAGARALLSINGSTFEATVPSGKTPIIEQHEGVTIVICNEAQVDAAWVAKDAIHIGVAGLDANDEPIPHADFRQPVRIGADGESKTSAMPLPSKPPRPPRLANWRLARIDDYIDGSADRYASIDGPAPMERLGAYEGYGWMRLRFTGGALGGARKVQAGFFESADRLHLFQDGEALGLVGEGPGASGVITPLQLRKGANTIVALIDNLGRRSAGLGMGEPKGLFGHAWEAAPVRPGKPTLEVGPSLSPLSFRTPLWGAHVDDRTDSNRITWKITHRRKTPLIISIDTTPGDGGFRALLLVNDDPVRAIGDHGGQERIVLDPDSLKRGVNVVQLAVLGDAERDLKWAAQAVTFHEGASCLTDKAEWAFARWEAPHEAAFAPVAKSAMSRPSGRPSWWRCEFNAPKETEDAPPIPPLMLDARGLSKGQIFLNSRNLCRYFVATPDGKKVPPQQLYFIPRPWLRSDRPNELLIFDEHGAAPDKCRLVFDAAQQSTPAPAKKKRQVQTAG
ncbi:MAG: hypothetical protein EA376_07085 [Phycisphaeraceae bacterium]|nr:MAG: hypothetical protein EA376_07085 [Phycisphaeraceae bacterium]